MTAPYAVDPLRALPAAAYREASHQVDLWDVQTGRPYEAGIHMLPIPEELVTLANDARRAAEPVLEGAVDDVAVAAVDRASAEVEAHVRESVASILGAGQLPGVVGGDHSVPLGAIAAAGAAHDEFGVLHVDAHADLRVAYQGFRQSHASIMHNVLAEVPQVTRLVQIGIRDVSEGEVRAARESDGRVELHFDHDWQRRLAGGESFVELCDRAIASLPAKVWISFDIDGLDPALCPNTGTPVPGGLSFVQACLLLERLYASGRHVIGFDLCEVAPGDDEWDAAVGARVLYKLCGFALLSRQALADD